MPLDHEDTQTVCALLTDLKVQLASQSASLEALSAKLDAHIEQDVRVSARHEAAIQESFRYHREADRFRARVFGVGVVLGLLATVGAGWLALAPHLARAAMDAAAQGAAPF